MLTFREYCKLIDEGRKEDDEYYRSLGWEGDPDDREFYADTKGKKSTTKWTVLAAVQNILGKDVVEEWNEVSPPEPEEMIPGKIYVMSSITTGLRPSFFPTRSETGVPGGILYAAKKIESRNSEDITPAVHEAYHAQLYLKSKGQGQFHGNEKVVNDLAEKWLKKNLGGFNVQVAMDKLGVSRIGYGINRAPYVPDVRKPAEMPKAARFAATQDIETVVKKKNSKSLWIGAGNLPGTKRPRA